MTWMYKMKRELAIIKASSFTLILPPFGTKKFELSSRYNEFYILVSKYLLFKDLKSYIFFHLLLSHHNVLRNMIWKHLHSFSSFFLKITPYIYPKMHSSFISTLTIKSKLGCPSELMFKLNLLCTFTDDCKCLLSQWKELLVHNNWDVVTDNISVCRNCLFEKLKVLSE